MLGHIVERLSEFAPVAARCFTVDAHVEELTVVRIGIAWMGRSLGFVHLRAGKLEHVLRRAALLLGLVRPGADAGAWIKHQPFRAGDHVEHTVHAVVELIARTSLAGKVTVLAGAVQGRYGCLCNI